MSVSRKKLTIIALSIVALLSLCYLVLFVDYSEPLNSFDLPAQVRKELCSGSKVLALTERAVHYQTRGSFIDRGLNNLFAKLLGPSYFTSEYYLEVIDLQQHKIIFDVPRVKVDSFVFSKDYRWVAYLAENQFFLRDVESGIIKRIDQSDVDRLLDWPGNGGKIVFASRQPLPTTKDPCPCTAVQLKVYMADVSSCLNDRSEICKLDAQPIQYPSVSWININYVHLIDNQTLLVKIRDTNAQVVKTTGEIVSEIPGTHCYNADYNGSTHQYLFSCEDHIDIYSSQLEKIRSIPVSKHIDYALWTPDGKQLMIESQDDPELARLNYAENSFYPSRLYLMNMDKPESLQTVPFVEHEKMEWYGFIGNNQGCQQ
jgi:hypothetical protein